MHRITRRFAALLACVVGVASGNAVDAAPKTSADNVKISVKADKAADGKQVVTLTLEVAKDWHLYANPVGNPGMLNSQTKVTFTAAGKLVAAKVVYPEGKLEKDKDVGDYRVYEGTVTIKATLDHPAPGPVEAAVDVSTCSTSLMKCLLPSTIKVKVE